MVHDTLRAEYEAAVRAIRSLVEAMRRDGTAVEDIARAAHEQRRRLATDFKERTPEPMRSLIYRHTAATYGDPLGPTLETLRAKGKTWEEIIESAARPGRPPRGGDA
ncbi:hypothetical protein M2352_000032 [Azospirillum fermentarium]|uniref:hypothetical protein n=1 Tax=Azospirillum fermentarium TaxID=1233114 RepID=UPI002226BA95|nr:hypothetical protein [Azospirillum fermentarium]MCW2244441.1 hypothetical protein [Azospirillum fermentarium]